MGMRNPALKEAIRAAGGVAALAKEISVTSQAVSQWRRVPADRVLAVERATGVPRQRLRPDIYGKRRPIETRPAVAADRGRGSTASNAALLRLLQRWRQAEAAEPQESEADLDAQRAALRADRLRLRTFDD